MKKLSSGNMPFTEQQTFRQPCSDLGETNAKPRCTAHDLTPASSRTRIGIWGDEQTFCVGRRGNKVTEGGNY